MSDTTASNDAQPPAADEAPREIDPLASSLYTLLGRLRHAEPGALAALRRLDPESPPPAFFRLTVDLLDASSPASGGVRDALETRWAVVARELARAGDVLLAPVRLGEALARAGVAEMRVLRLLEARDAQLYDVLRTVVHQLVSKGQPFDPRQLAKLVVRGDEHIRRAIARDFYRHQST